MERSIGPVRRAVASDDRNPVAEMQVNNRGEQLVAQGLPPKSELVRLGRTFSVCICANNKFTHVAAWPTTLSELHLYNGEPTGGRSYVIDAIWAGNIATSAGAATNYTLLAQLVSNPAVPTDDPAQLITSRSSVGICGTSYPGRGKRAVHDTVAIADRWEVVGVGTSGGATATIGIAAYADVYGGWIVPPAAMLCTNLVVGTGTGTATIGIVWHEVQLDLGKP